MMPAYIYMNMNPYTYNLWWCGSTESRIAENQYDNDVPAASKYYPKTGTIGDLAPRNPRHKAFGGTDTVSS